MSRRLSSQRCPQVHRRDLSKNPIACGPCGHLSHLTPNTVATLVSSTFQRFEYMSGRDKTVPTRGFRDRAKRLVVTSGHKAPGPNSRQG